MGEGWARGGGGRVVGVKIRTGASVVLEHLPLLALHDWSGGPVVNSVVKSNEWTTNFANKLNIVDCRFCVIVDV